MARLIAGVALALALAGCNTTSESPQQAAATEPAELQALEPASGEAAATVEATEPEAAATEVAAVEPEPTAVAESSTPGVDDAAQNYLNCVVSHAAQSAEAGDDHEHAVEVGVDACRNQFREARWAYKDTGATDSAADRYGVNLLTFVRTEARNFLDTSVQ